VCGEKLYPPRKHEKLYGDEPEIDEEEYVIEGIIGSPEALGLIRDTGLTIRDKFYWSQVYKKYIPSTNSDFVAVILQNLWTFYGNVTSDRTLLYSILAWGSSFNWNYTNPWKRIGDHEYYKTKFRTSLAKASAEGTISELHFFAVFFAVLDSFHEIKEHNAERTLRDFTGSNEELRNYQLLLLIILKRLNEQEAERRRLDELEAERRRLNGHETEQEREFYEQETETRESNARRLQHLYNYALSLVRLWSSNTTNADITYDMHLVTEKTPMPKQIVDVRSTFALPAQFWLRQGGDPSWQGVEMSLSDDIRALFACFQKMLLLNRAEQADDSPANGLLSKSIEILGLKALKMQELPSVKKVLQRVSPTGVSS
jgi:hypothetical protein